MPFRYFWAILYIQILTALGGMAQIISPKLSQNHAIWPLGACAEGQAGFWSYRHEIWISADFEIKNLTLECIKTAVFDTRNPKSPYRRREGCQPPSHTHPPLGQFTPSRSYLPLFSYISCLIPVLPQVMNWSHSLTPHLNSVYTVNSAYQVESIETEERAST